MIGAEDQSAATRQHVHRMWAAVAPHWAKHADGVDAAVEVITRRLVELVAPRPGQRILELACGPGGLGLAMAPLVAPGGHVVLSDVVPEMVSAAAARAAARGVTSVSTRVLDLERIDCPDADFDAVLCREGLMFAVHPDAACREIRRVLRPGGRLAASVWGARADNPWLGLLADAVEPEVGHPVPPPGMPGPFALADPTRLEELLSHAGLTDVTVSALDLTVNEGDFETYWALRTALAGPLTALLARMAPDALQRVRARVRASLAPYDTHDGLIVPRRCVIATASR
jgi:ubiquinone/menaquinone biosynthesis C-methylase UbiE